MKIRGQMAAAALFVAITPTVSVDAQVVTEMTPALVLQAIADEKNEGCYKLRGDYGCFTTPYSRVVQAARRARKQYEKFTEADVKPDMMAPVVEVLAFPQPRFIMGRGRKGPPLDVSAVVVMPRDSKDRAAAIQPTSRADLDARYQNLLGASWQARGIVATFPLSVLSESNEVRVVYDGLGCADWKNKLMSECGFQFKLDKVR